MHSVSAFESTSASFEIHAGDVESTTGTSTSATFQLHNAGGQNATGSSTATTYSVSSGILYWFMGFFTAQYNQAHYRWRGDGSGCVESATTAGCWPVDEDNSYVTFPKNTLKRLRVEVANDGWSRGAAPSFQFSLQVASTTTTCATPVSAYVNVPTAYGAGVEWVIASTSPNVANNALTTNVGTPPAAGLTDVGNTWVDGVIKTTDNLTGSVTLATGSFTELEYALVATSVATDGAYYCFRVTDNGSTTNFTYSNYGQATIASGLSATGSLDSAVFDTFDGGGAGKGPAYNSIMWKGSTEGTGKVRFQLATSESPSGPWNWYGDDGVNPCGSGFWYDTRRSVDNPAGGPDKPVELSCSPTYHNNQRYFRYKIQICSAADCSSSGANSPIVDDVVVNWAP